MMLITEVPQPLPAPQMSSWFGCDAFAASTEVSEARVFAILQLHAHAS